MPTTEEIVDRALGIDEAVKQKIAATVRELYPNRSEAALTAITRRAKALWTVGDDDLSRSMVAALAKIDPALTRRTPTPDDIVAYRESQAKTRGLTWDAQKRLSAFREAQGMDDAARLAAVGADFKLSDATPKAETATPVSATAEKLDAEIEKRFGLAPGTARSMSAIKRRDLHAYLEREEAAGKKPEAPGATTQKPGTVGSLYERMAKRPVVGRKTG